MPLSPTSRQALGLTCGEIASKSTCNPGDEPWLSRDRAEESGGVPEDRTRSAPTPHAQVSVPVVKDSAII